MIKKGEVYLVDDSLIVTPANPGRALHSKRPVVVIQADAVTVRPDVKTVLVVPASSSQPVGPFDHDTEDEIENGFTKSGIGMFTSLVQPILKTHLTNRQGTVSPDCLEKLHDLVSQLIGEYQ